MHHGSQQPFIRLPSVVFFYGSPVARFSCPATRENTMISGQSKQGTTPIPFQTMGCVK
jgi:hypothetical protein